MPLNKEHPDCKAYTEEFEKLKAEHMKRIEAIQPSKMSLDDPEDSAAVRDFCRSIKELQARYQHLFQPL